MKNKLMNNLGLKILAILCSIVLWFIVINISDPNTTKKFENISVEVVNSSVITDQNKVYEILEDSDTVDVTVVAKRSIIDNLNDEDIRAIADFSNLTLSNTIEIQLSTKAYNSSLTSIKSNISSLKLNIEDKIQKQFRVESNTTGELEDGYLIGDISTDTNLVNISGAESIISQVARVEAAVNITGMTSDVSAKADLKFYDVDDNLIDSSKIVKNISSVIVNVKILSTKTVNVVASAMGVTADGYQTTGVVECSPSTVLIAGDSKTLKSISEIVIPEDAINVTGKNENLTTIVDLDNYMPDGVQLANSDFNGKITVTAYIEKEIMKEVTITDAMISVRNLPNDFEYAIVEFNGEAEEILPIQIAALQSVIDSFDGNLYGVIDVNNLIGENSDVVKPGTYVVIPTFTLSGGMRMLTTCELTLVITEKEE